MKQKSQLDAGFQVGDRVILIAGTLAWKAEITLQGKIGEVIERRQDGRITVRFDNGRLLVGSEPESFDLVSKGAPSKAGAPDAIRKTKAK
jgi:hypothetical protein